MKYYANEARGKVQRFIRGLTRYGQDFEERPRWREDRRKGQALVDVAAHLARNTGVPHITFHVDRDPWSYISFSQVSVRGMMAGSQPYWQAAWEDYLTEALQGLELGDLAGLLSSPDPEVRSLTIRLLGRAKESG